MSRQRKFEMVPHCEEQAKRIANIMGPSSAHAQALDQLYLRRSAGEDVYLWVANNAILVGPMPGEEHDHAWSVD